MKSKVGAVSLGRGDVAYDPAETQTLSDGLSFWGRYFGYFCTGTHTDFSGANTGDAGTD